MPVSCAFVSTPFARERRVRRDRQDRRRHSVPGRAASVDDCASSSRPGPARRRARTRVSRAFTFVSTGSAREVGWRAAAAALSIWPREGADAGRVLAALSCPGVGVDDDLVALMAGVGDAAAAAGAPVSGGDLSRGPLDRDDYGARLGDHAGDPRGARPGDGLWVTGALGGSRAALEAWRRGERARRRRRGRRSRIRFPARRGTPARARRRARDDRLERWTRRRRAHLAQASGVAIDIELDAVPAAAPCIEEARRLGISPAAVRGGGWRGLRAARRVARRVRRRATRTPSSVTPASPLTASARRDTGSAFARRSPGGRSPSRASIIFVDGAAAHR